MKIADVQLLMRSGYTLMFIFPRNFLFVQYVISFHMNRLNARIVIAFFAKKTIITPRNKKTHAHYAKSNLGQLKIQSIFHIKV